MPAVRALATIAQDMQKDGITVLSMQFDADTDGWYLNGHKNAGDAPEFEIWHMTQENALEQASTDWGVQAQDWKIGGDSNANKTPTRDSNGTILADGDTITVIKDLPVKGTSTVIKRGTTIKNIRLTDNPENIDCPSAQIRGLVLKSCFVKKI